MKQTLSVLLIVFMFLNASKAHDNYNGPLDSIQSDEEMLDIVLDCYFIGSSAMHVITTGTGWGALALDLGCAFVPGACGIGTLSTKAIKGTGTTMLLNKSIKVGQVSKVSTKQLNNLIECATIAAKTGVRPSLIDDYAAFSRFSWTATTHNKFLTHVVARHSEDFLPAIANNTVEAQKLLNEVMERMATGKFHLRNCENLAPYASDAAIMVCIDMGRVIGQAGERFVNVIMHKGGGTMYPISSIEKFQAKTWNLNMIK